MGMEHVEYIRRWFHNILSRGPDAAPATQLYGRRSGHILRRHYLLVFKDIKYFGC